MKKVYRILKNYLKSTAKNTFFQLNDLHKCRHFPVEKKAFSEKITIFPWLDLPPYLLCLQEIKTKKIIFFHK